MIEDKKHGQPHGYPCPSISYLIYSMIIVFCYGEIGSHQFHIIASISTSCNRKMRYCPTALRCG